LIDVDAASFDTLPCCGIKNPTHPGRQQKHCWLQANAKFGLRAKMLLAPDGQPSGYIEYLPGEFAWRGVESAGFMLIHCVWIFVKQHRRKGWGSVMVEACLDDARKAGMRGASAMVRDGPWLADRRLFLANGFESVDTAPPDYQLLVRKFDSGAGGPAFKKGTGSSNPRWGSPAGARDLLKQRERFAEDCGSMAPRRGRISNSGGVPDTVDGCGFPVADTGRGSLRCNTGHCGR